MKDENPEARFPIFNNLRNPRLKLTSFYLAASEIFLE